MIEREPWMARNQRLVEPVDFEEGISCFEIGADGEPFFARNGLSYAAPQKIQVHAFPLRARVIPWKPE
jgi:hypothetical protein